MAQDIIFDRMELVQPHDYSWPAAPYHANIRKEEHPSQKKWSHKLPDSRAVSIDHLGSCFPCPITHVASVLPLEFFSSENKCFFCAITLRPLAKKLSSLAVHDDFFF